MMVKQILIYIVVFISGAVTFYLLQEPPQEKIIEKRIETQVEVASKEQQQQIETLKKQLALNTRKETRREITPEKTIETIIEETESKATEEKKVATLTEKEIEVKEKEVSNDIIKVRNTSLGFSVLAFKIFNFDGYSVDINKTVIGKIGLCAGSSFGKKRLPEYRIGLSGNF